MGMFWKKDYWVISLQDRKCQVICRYMANGYCERTNIDGKKNSCRFFSGIIITLTIFVCRIDKETQS